MQLCLGRHAYDVGARALVVAALEGGRGAEIDAVVAEALAAVAEGADAVEVSAGEAAHGGIGVVRALVDRLAVPVGVVTERASVAAAAFDAGACLARDPSGFSDPGFLGAVAAASATVVVTCPGPAPAVEGVAALLDGAAAAGIHRERLVVDAGLDLRPPDQALDLLRRTTELVALGLPVVVAATGAAVDAVAGASGLRREAALSLVALGVTHGCRVVRTSDARGARRVCDVLAAVIEAG